MPLSIAQIVFDCDDAVALATFWSRVLERPVDEGANGFFASIGRGGENTGPAMMFIKVPEAKQVKNRVHVDLTGSTGAAGWPAEVERLIGLGAVQLAEHKEFGTQWVTLADPEGNEFDLGAG